MNTSIRRTTAVVFAVLAFGFIGVPFLHGQASKVVFQDDFVSNTIDPAKYQPDAPFFEGGIGDIHATAHDGVIEFVVTTTQQWWSGGPLGVVRAFEASEALVLTVWIVAVEGVDVD